MEFKDMEFVSIPKTNFEIMQNGSGEIFIRYDKLELRLSPQGTAFTICDWNSPGKMHLNGELLVT